MSKLDFFESFQPTQRDPIQDIGTSLNLFLHGDWYQEPIFFLTLEKIIRKWYLLLARPVGGQAIGLRPVTI